MAAAHPVMLLHIITVPLTLGFLKGLVASLRKLGIEVHLLSPPEADLDKFERQEQYFVHSIEIARRITPLKGVIALACLLHEIGKIS